MQMIRNKKTCENCQTTYDMMTFECPNCHKHNYDFDKTHTSKWTVSVSISHQIIYFAIGFVGLNIISLIVELIILAVNGFDKNAMDNAFNRSLSVIIIYFVLFIAMSVFVILDRKKFKHIFKPWYGYVAGFIGGVLLIFISIAYNTIIANFLPIQDNANETAVNSVLTTMPVLSVLVLAKPGTCYGTPHYCCYTYKRNKTKYRRNLFSACL